MTLKEFIALTADLPEDADLWILNPDSLWTAVEHMEVRQEDVRHIHGYDREKQPHLFTKNTEIRLKGK